MKVFSIQYSVFSAQPACGSSMFDVRCSMFDVSPVPQSSRLKNSQPASSTEHETRNTKHCPPQKFVSRHSSVVIPHAFTLIELMIVIGIMGIIVAMGIPMVYHALHREGLTKAVNDVEEVLGNARRLAILQGTMTEVIFHPRDLRCEVAGGGGAKPSSNDAPGASFEAAPPAPANSGLSAQFADHIKIEMLDINLTEYREAEVARVRFYPNGTCDELKIVLANEAKQFGIELEVTTGLATVVPDIRVWARR